MIWHPEIKDISRILTAFTLLFCSFFLLPTPACANDKYASLVMDADTGEILSQSSADKMVHPASLTKVMTLLMVFDALDHGRLNLNDRLVISRNAASMVPSKLNIAPGSTIRVQDAIYALVTKSANDIAVAFAEKLGKTETRFAVMMTKRAHEIGMTRTRFMNASGLHHPKQVTTARDMAKLGRYLIKMKPDHYRYFSRREFSYRGATYKNHNHMLGEYNGMDGIKTGYIQASGFNLLASAKRGNRRLIGVVFGGKTSKSRNASMKELLDAGFALKRNMRSAKAFPLPVRNPKRAETLPPAFAEPFKDITVTSATGLTKDLLETPSDNASHPPQDTRFEVAFKTVEIHHPTPVLPVAPVRQPANENNDTQASALSAKDEPQTLGTLNLAQLTATSQPGFHDVNISLERDWGIQIGAFSERDTTDKVLHQAYGKLPAALQYAAPQVAPVQGKDGWIYRAWLTGFTQNDAKSACIYYKDCMVIQPQIY
ncbi:MAG: D-alanyl-D-alanine carboxypeptidase [Rhodospirillales bacterium]|nr:D-alanyl-D-alanine carboxypeptidase [Rhodospirillales bacterium]